MPHYTRLSLLTFAIALAATGFAAHATRVDKADDALTIIEAKVPLAKAVAIAEQHANGKASRAEYEKSAQGWIYDVEVVSGTRVFDVRVDAGKGTVISSAEDKADHDDDHDERD
ncbi:MAG: PepSY domain-containing protein [Ramlibacter sp.]|nr:PepSY domain-containing protein [Ramlibacter sp.]